MTSAIILAGGLGTRLRSAVPDLPKPMAPISGRPFLEYLLDYWIKQEVNHFVLSVCYQHNVICDHFGSSYKDTKLEYVIEEKPLGTGGGLLLAIDKLTINKPFLLLNGDTYFGVDLKKLISFSQTNNADWCFSLYRSHEERRYMGMDIATNGKINSLKSGTGRPGSLVNGGVYWVNPRALSNSSFPLGDLVSLEDDIFPVLMDSGQHLFGIEFEVPFIDIGIPSDYHRALAILAKQKDAP